MSSKEIEEGGRVSCNREDEKHIHTIPTGCEKLSQEMNEPKT